MKFLLWELFLINIFFTLLCVLKCDIPVHCLKSQIIGEWDFKATEPIKKTTAELFSMTCGHKNPSHESSSHKMNMDLSEFTKKFSVNFYNNDGAALTDNSATKNGKWTMVYDEGFDFSFGNKNSKDYSTYFVFSKYAPNDSSNDNVNSKWASYCHSTLIGWYQIGKKYGCFYGVKRGEDHQRITNGEASNKQVVVEGSLTKKENFLQVNDNNSAVFNNENTNGDAYSENFYKPEIRFMESKFSEKLELTAEFKDHSRVVERINSENGSWKAADYKEFQGLTIAQLNKLAGRKKSRSGHFFEHNFHQVEEKNQESESETVFDMMNVNRPKNYLKPKSSSRNSNDLPAEFSWKEKMGYAKSQGSCGSCYAAATITMLEARFRIKYESTMAKYFSDPKEFTISLQHVLDCSVYNQGCDGGYSYLVSKFFFQFDLFLDKCYQKNSGKDKCHMKNCSDSKLNDLKLSVKDFYYVGGAYGKTNEENLMVDLYKNGPIVVSLEPEYAFMVYKSGIFDFKKESWLTKNLTKPQWQKVDHSVVLVGWGVDFVNGKELKYWLLQNSWGSHWGENGYVRFRRGSDLMGIESIGEAAIPDIK